MPSGSKIVLQPKPDEVKFHAPDHTQHRHVRYLVTGCKKLTEIQTFCLKNPNTSTEQCAYSFLRLVLSFSLERIFGYGLSHWTPGNSTARIDS